MCIRDSFQTSSIAQKYNCALTRLDFQQEEGLMSSLPPVSYTHLDVYKRQEYPTGFVQLRFEKITSMHIEKVMDGIRERCV